MASSLFILLDDLATILDDVAAMTKVAAGKTAGVLGDDLALNAEQVTGVMSERELPVVWAVAKGSFVNKAILVPAALAISAFIPWAITPLLMCGGAYLCFEGCEKILHKFLHPAPKSEISDDGIQKPVNLKLAKVASDPAIDLGAFEKEKVKGAIRTDFILSAEIIVISLGTVAGAPFAQQITVLILIAIVMTIGVYGLVGAIVKLDDLGFLLVRRKGSLAKRCGLAILSFAPFLLKSLSTLGTLAMFLVGGGIIVHGIHPLHEFILHLVGEEGVIAHLVPLLFNIVLGFLVGALVLGALKLIRWG